MIVFCHCLLDQVIIDQDIGLRVGFAFNPDLHLPAVAMEARAFPLIVEQAMARIDLHFLIDPDFHCTVLVGAGYKIIMSEE